MYSRAVKTVVRSSHYRPLPPCLMQSCTRRGSGGGGGRSKHTTNKKQPAEEEAQSKKKHGTGKHAHKQTRYVLPMDAVKRHNWSHRRSRHGDQGRIAEALALFGPLSLVLAAHGEEACLGTTTLQAKIITAAMWAFDGEGGAEYRRARYEALLARRPLVNADDARPLLDASALVERAGAPPSSTRRVASWAVDMAVMTIGQLSGVAVWHYVWPRSAVALAPLVGPATGVVAWGTRDLWLSRYGLQSPGRAVMGQQVYALGSDAEANPDREVWATIKLNSAFAATVRLVLPTLASSARHTKQMLSATKFRSATLLLAPVQLGVFGAVGYCVMSPVWSLLFDPHGAVWMDRVAKTQVLDLPGKQQGWSRRHDPPV
jgi:hypothetical protein